MYRETQLGVQELQSKVKRLEGETVTTADVFELWRGVYIRQQTGVDIFAQYKKNEAVQLVRRRLGELLKASGKDPGHSGDLLKIVLSALKLQRKDLLRIAIMPEEEEEETVKLQ
jgi:hypothetical protein